MDTHDSSQDAPSQAPDGSSPEEEAADQSAHKPEEGVALEREPAQEPPGPAEAATEGPSRDEPRDAPPPSGPRPDDTFPTHLLIGAGIFAFLLLVGAGFFWKAHSDRGSLQRDVSVLRAQVQRSQVLQELAALLRVRAELQALRQTVTQELALEVDKADGILTGIDERLKALP